MKNYSLRFPRLFAFLSLWDNRLAPYAEPVLYAFAIVEVAKLILDLIFEAHPLALAQKILFILLTCCGSCALHWGASEKARVSLLDFFRRVQKLFFDMFK